MKSIRVIALFYIAILLTTSIAKAEEAVYLRNIFITANGNNKPEAIIKANELGMRRGIAIIADKMDIKGLNTDRMRYDALAKVFTAHNVRHEQYDGEWYSATVDYTYNRHQANELIFRFITPKESKMAYECLLIPVLKQQKKIVLWDDSIPWINIWDQILPHLEQHKLFYPEKMLAERNQITAQNVFNMTYDDFLGIFPEQLFRTVVLVVAEYFTSNDGQEYLQVDYITHTTNDVTKSIKRYNIFSARDVIGVLQQAANDALGKYDVNTLEVVQNQQAVQFHVRGSEDSEYIMFAEAYDAESIPRIQSKLNSVQGIKNFSITNDGDNRYKIVIHTKDTLETLANGLYLNNLSYIKIGDEYHLTESTSGI